ncbi:MAG: hypothetical protein C4346_18985, partial [Chloroflexota bacterium]
MSLAALQGYRDATRYRHYEVSTDLHNFPRGSVAGWRYLDNPSRPLTIAFTTGWTPPGHHWFLYPLMGRRLQNRITYISPAPSGALLSYAPGFAGS